MNPTFVAEPGQRVRLRIVNASTMTFLRCPHSRPADDRGAGRRSEHRTGGPYELRHRGGRDLRRDRHDARDDRAYTLFAETMDRSGFARGTLAPRGACPPRSRTAPAPADAHHGGHGHDACTAAWTRHGAMPVRAQGSCDRPQCRRAARGSGTELPPRTSSTGSSTGRAPPRPGEHHDGADRLSSARLSRSGARRGRPPGADLRPTPDAGDRLARPAAHRHASSTCTSPATCTSTSGASTARSGRSRR